MNLIPSSNTMLIVAAYYVFSAAVSSMPPPQAGAHPVYQWFYKFANTLSANVTALRGKAQFDPPPTSQTQVTAVQTQTETVTKAEVPKP